MPHRTIQTETVYRGRAFAVRVDEVEWSPGRTVRMDVVDHPDAITILPMDEAGHVWFIRQYRHPVEQSILELPAGTLKEGEDPAEAANRELQEEIGQRAERLEHLASFWLAPGYSTELMHVFLATGLSESRLDMDEDEQIEVEKMAPAEALALAENGGLRDAKSLVAVLAAARRLGW